MPSKIVIYHGNCPDGFASAWVAKNALPGPVEFIAAFYNQPPPDVVDKEVYVCDFSYPRDVLLDMKAKAKSLVVLDHHKTALEALQGLDFCFFDMNRSGAAMTWDYFYNYNQPGTRHWLIDYVQDRDLWTWKLKDSKAINSAIACRPFTFEAWDKMASRSAFLLSLEGNIVEELKGTQTELYQDQTYITNFDGREVPAVNIPKDALGLNSELAGTLSEGYDFAIAWSYLGEGLFRYSLRNTGQCDTAKVAEKYGGGGHAKASGFTSKDFLVPAIRPLRTSKKEASNGT